MYEEESSKQAAHTISDKSSSQEKQSSAYERVENLSKEKNGSVQLSPGRSELLSITGQCSKPVINLRDEAEEESKKVENHNADQKVGYQSIHEAVAH